LPSLSENSDDNEKNKTVSTPRRRAATSLDLDSEYDDYHDHQVLKDEIAQLKEQLKETQMNLTHEKHAKENLQEESDLIISGLQDMGSKQEELENKISEMEQQEEALNNEIEDLNLQLEDMENQNEDLARQFNTQNIEMQGMFTMVERDKHYRMELTTKLHHEEHMKKVLEKNCADTRNELTDAKEKLEKQTGEFHHVRDELASTKMDLTNKIRSLDEEKRALAAEKFRLTNELGRSTLKLRSKSVESFSGHFVSGVVSAVSSRLQTFVEEDDAEIDRLSKLASTLEKTLSVKSNDLKLERRDHEVTLAHLKKSDSALDTVRKKISVLVDVKADLETETGRLDNELEKMTKKYDDKCEAYIELTSENEMNNAMISEMSTEIDKVGKQRLSQVAEKEIELARTRKASMDLESELGETGTQLNTERANVEKAERRLRIVEADLRKTNIDKSNLSLALEKIVDNGNDGLNLIDNFLRGGKRDAEDIWGKNTRERRMMRRRSIFEDNTLGAASAPLDLVKGSDVLKMCYDDFVGVAGGWNSGVGDTDPFQEGGSEEVGGLLEGVKILGGLMRRVGVV